MRPIVRALACCAAGSLPARIEMKMMLSTPSTISSTVNVIRLIQICGSLTQANHSIGAQNNGDRASRSSQKPRRLRFSLCRSNRTDCDEALGQSQPAFPADLTIGKQRFHFPAAQQANFFEKGSVTDAIGGSAPAADRDPRYQSPTEADRQPMGE